VPTLVSIQNAVAAIAASGWRIVVSGGVAQVAIGRSSKPVTLTSSGARSPRSPSAWSTPKAWASLPAMIAVGGSGRPRSFLAWRSPASAVSSSQCTSASSTGSPARRSAAW